jgi:hypothetical protein
MRRVDTRIFKDFKMLILIQNNLVHCGSMRTSELDSNADLTSQEHHNRDKCYRHVINFFMWKWSSEPIGINRDVARFSNRMRPPRSSMQMMKMECGRDEGYASATACKWSGGHRGRHCQDEEGLVCNFPRSFLQNIGSWSNILHL